ncbi:MAG: helix-turn-helix domain-containing protein [Steroidobacteraceae bacterium]
MLSLAEREEISRGIAAGCTIRCIARAIGRAVSTVSQEVSWHGGRDRYRAAEAACALAARADLIVTRDLDLLDSKSCQNIPILAAADALRRIEAQR